jgi:hypothetical protein
VCEDGSIAYFAVVWQARATGSKLGVRNTARACSVPATSCLRANEQQTVPSVAETQCTMNTRGVALRHRAIVLAGGHGALLDYPTCGPLQALVAQALDTGAVRQRGRGTPFWLRQGNAGLMPLGVLQTDLSDPQGLWDPYALLRPSTSDARNPALAMNMQDSRSAAAPLSAMKSLWRLVQDAAPFAPLRSRRWYSGAWRCCVRLGCTWAGAFHRQT